MPTDPDRLLAAVSALAGGAFWGVFHLATTLLAGQPVGQAQMMRAGANVLVGMSLGVLAGYFLAPAIAPLIPFESLRDLHAVGFGIGAGAWELAPIVYRVAKGRAAKLENGLEQDKS